MNNTPFPTRWANDRPPSLEKFTSDFPDDYACAEYLAKKRWSNGFKCPKCCGNRNWRLESRPWVFECKGIIVDDNGDIIRTGCCHQTSVIAGTVMHGTHLPLRKWFLAAYLVATHSNGISALQLQPKLGLGSYKTAWLLLHKLRRAMINPDRKPLNGVVEIDETSIVFRKKTEPVGGGQGRSTRGKMFLLGAVEVYEHKYPGRIRLGRIPDTSRDSIEDFIEQNVSSESHLLTDGYTAYRNATKDHTAFNLSSDNAPLAHEVLPWVHRVFSNFKRWTSGTYHGVRDKHVDIYCNEFVFRWNRRRHFQSNIDTLLGFGQKIGPITRRAIVGDTKQWKHDHHKQILSMVSPARLKRAKEYASKNGLVDVFDALDDVRSEEVKRKYVRRKPKRPVLPPRRSGEEKIRIRYIRPPRLSPDDIIFEFQGQLIAA